MSEAVGSTVGLELPFETTGRGSDLIGRAVHSLKNYYSVVRNNTRRFQFPALTPFSAAASGCASCWFRRPPCALAVRHGARGWLKVYILRFSTSSFFEPEFPGLFSFNATLLLEMLKQAASFSTYRQMRGSNTGGIGIDGKTGERRGKTSHDKDGHHQTRTADSHNQQRLLPPDEYLQMCSVRTSFQTMSR